MMIRRHLLKICAKLCLHSAENDWDREDKRLPHQFLVSGGKHRRLRNFTTWNILKSLLQAGSIKIADTLPSILQAINSASHVDDSKPLFGRNHVLGIVWRVYCNTNSIQVYHLLTHSSWFQWTGALSQCPQRRYVSYCFCQFHDPYWYFQVFNTYYIFIRWHWWWEAQFRSVQECFQVVHIEAWLIGVLRTRDWMVCGQAFKISQDIMSKIGLCIYKWQLFLPSRSPSCRSALWNGSRKTLSAVPLLKRQPRSYHHALSMKLIFVLY